MDIEKINEQEYQLVKEANVKYGEYYNLAKQLTEYSFDIIKSNYKGYLIVCLLYAPIPKCLTLTLLSIIRKHSYQHSLNIRTALDYLTLMLYSMEKPDSENFGCFNTEKVFKHDDNSVYNASKWLKEKYGSAIDSFKHLKDIINQEFAHSNINNAKLNISINEDFSTETKQFDIVDDIDVEVQIMGFCSLLLNLYELIELVAKDYPNAIVLRDNFSSDLQNFIQKYLILEKTIFKEREEYFKTHSKNL
jgi:hypothetical protein